MAFVPSDAVLPARRSSPSDPRLLELLREGQADIHLAGVPYDASVLGRKGARHGPRGIREAMRFFATDDPDQATDLAGLCICDHGDVAGLVEAGDDVLAAHGLVREAVRPLFQSGKPVVLLGGDHGLTYPHVEALVETLAPDERVGIVVVDAHYDVRAYDGQPTSGTPFRRILTQLPAGRVRARNLVEVGIRAYANSAVLAAQAAEFGIRVVTADETRRRGADLVAKEAVQWAGDGVQHLWLSIDIDGLDQSVACGCSAPGPGGLRFWEVARIVRAVAQDGRCRGMDLMEVAPELDPTGNTTRVAAAIVAQFVGGVARR